MPGDVVETLLAIRRENMDLSVRQVIVRARATGTVPDDVVIAPSTLHRLFTREGLMKRRADAPSGDLRRFATEAAGQLWQSDVMHGPKVRDTRGRKRKTYLIALLDDATRVVPYAHFALGETAADYLVVLKEAILRRGCPERLFCDNGANFRSRQLMMVCGRLGISLLHARPYHPAGRGKIERFFRTVRGQFLAPLDPQDIPDLETLNQRFRALGGGRIPHGGSPRPRRATHPSRPVGSHLRQGPPAQTPASISTTCSCSRRPGGSPGPEPSASRAASTRSRRG